MKLLILPFDHRSSFSKKILKIKGKPNSNQIKQIKKLKDLIYKAFLQVREEVENPEDLGILVDEQYGSEIIKKANSQGITTAVGVEKSGQKTFKFEYGKNFPKHIENLQPDYVKALVRYNPENTKINKKQLKKLKKLSDYCTKENHKLLLEVLVPPTEKDKASERDYDKEIRPQKTKKAIEELMQVVDADIWKLEGFDSKNWNLVLESFGEKQNEVKIIVLGRGENEEKVNFWLQEAAKYKQIIGFAIGRTIFMQPLLKLLDNKLSEEETKLKIAENYKGFINLWRKSKKQT